MPDKIVRAVSDESAQLKFFAHMHTGCNEVAMLVAGLVISLELCYRKISRIITFKQTGQISYAQ